MVWKKEGFVESELEAWGTLRVMEERKKIERRGRKRLPFIVFSRWPLTAQSAVA